MSSESQVRGVYAVHSEHTHGMVQMHQMCVRFTRYVVLHCIKHHT